MPALPGDGQANAVGVDHEPLVKARGGIKRNHRSLVYCLPRISGTVLALFLREPLELGMLSRDICLTVK